MPQSKHLSPRDILARVDVTRAGDRTDIEARKDDDFAGKLYSPAIPGQLFRKVAREASIPDMSASLASLSAKELKRETAGSRWDIPIMQLVGWLYTQNLHLGVDYPERVYLGNPQEIGAVILGTPKLSDVDTRQRQAIKASLDRLCELHLSDIGWTEIGGAPALCSAPLLIRRAVSNGQHLVEVGDAYRPDAREHARALFKAKAKDYIPTDFEETLRLVPIQSQGLTLGAGKGYLPGSSNNTHAAQDRAYSLIHAEAVDRYHKGTPGVRLNSKGLRDRVADLARLGYDRWGNFLRHLVDSGHYHRDTETGLWHPTDARAVEWLRIGSDRMRRKVKAGKAKAKREKAASRPAPAAKPKSGPKPAIPSRHAEVFAAYRDAKGLAPDARLSARQQYDAFALSRGEAIA